MPKVSELSYDSLSDQFIEIAPTLRDAYRQMLDDWEDEVPGQTIVFDDIISPYIIRLLRCAVTNGAQLKAVFLFLEAMARHEDRHVRDALAVTVCEHILGHKDIYRVAKSLMGSATRQIMDSTAAHREVTAWNAAGSAENA
jgi:prophage DNA circulation protein